MNLHRRQLAAWMLGASWLPPVASAVVIAPLVSPARHRWDGLRQLLPVAPVASSAFVLAARPDLPVADTAQLLQLSRQQPGRLSVGTDGIGTSLHLAAELIQQQAGLALMHVPYKSGPQALAELAGGQIDLAVLPVALVQAFVREGKIKGLGVTSGQRVATLPQTPSLSETPALHALDIEAWQGLLLPSGTDASIAERLSREVAAVLAEPATARRLAEAGFKPMAMSQTRFIAYLEQERQLLQATVRSAGIRVD